MAFLDDPDIPAYSIRVMRNGTEAEITGASNTDLPTISAKFSKLHVKSRSSISIV
jgi:hypothetical protein